MNRRSFIRHAGIAGIITAATFPGLAKDGFGYRSFTIKDTGATIWWDARWLGASNAARDRSGFGGNGTNANVTIQSAVDRGRDVFRFNGTNAKLSLAFNSSTTFSCFIRMKSTNSTTAASFIGFIKSDALNQLLCNSAGPVLACYSGASNNPKSSTIDCYSAFSVIGVVCTSGTCVFYQDGVSVGTGAQTIGALDISSFGGSTAFFAAFDMQQVFFSPVALDITRVKLASHALTYK